MLKDQPGTADDAPVRLIKRVIARWRHTTRPTDVADAAERSGAGIRASDKELQAALVETEHERDVSIARASQAEERELLARERLGSLASLEHRVEVAERRALDAERRLEEISERVNGPGGGSDASNAATDAKGSGPAGPSADLRARLTRAATRKHRHREPE